MKRKLVYNFFKRIFDVTCSLIAIIVFGIPMLIVAIAIKCDSKGPIFFKQICEKCWNETYGIKKEIELIESQDFILLKNNK